MVPYVFIIINIALFLRLLGCCYEFPYKTNGCRGVLVTIATRVYGILC